MGSVEVVDYLGVLLAIAGEVDRNYGVLVAGGPTGLLSRSDLATKLLHARSFFGACASYMRKASELVVELTAYHDYATSKLADLCKQACDRDKNPDIREYERLYSLCKGTDFHLIFRTTPPAPDQLHIGFDAEGLYRNISEDWTTTKEFINTVTECSEKFFVWEESMKVPDEHIAQLASSVLVPLPIISAAQDKLKLMSSAIEEAKFQMDNIKAVVKKLCEVLETKYRPWVRQAHVEIITGIKKFSEILVEYNELLRKLISTLPNTMEPHYTPNIPPLPVPFLDITKLSSHNTPEPSPKELQYQTEYTQKCVFLYNQIQLYHKSHNQPQTAISSTPTNTP
ncbi:hypothetical protein Pelo_7079 [Pelomyxa schiedti]|nr:hypothetical protein Pelo_7079 [Pelomyxa schiedti]